MSRSRNRRLATARTVHRAAYKLAQRVMTLDVTHLMRLDLEGMESAASAPADVTLRFLSHDEVREFATPENDLPSEFADRIKQRGDHCFAALIGSRLAAYAWFALKSIEAEHNRGGQQRSGVAVSFPGHVAFMYKGFTHPEFRGLGLYGCVNAEGLQALRRLGVTTVISTADWTNWSALRSCWRLGYQDLGRVWRVGCGRLTFTRAPQKAKSLGISVS